MVTKGIGEEAGSVQHVSAGFLPYGLHTFLFDVMVELFKFKVVDHEAQGIKVDVDVDYDVARISFPFFFFLASLGRFSFVK